MPDIDDLLQTDFLTGKKSGTSSGATTASQASGTDDDLLHTDFITGGAGSKGAAPSSTQTLSSPIVQTPKGEPQDMSWGDVGQQAIKNVGPSAYEFGHSIYQTVAHPMDTASAIGNLGTGIYSKAKSVLGYQPTAQEKQSEVSVDTLADFYKRRYGSLAGFKEALATDPIGILADLATPFTGGETGAAKATSLLGKAGEVVQGAAKVVDPLNIATQIPEKLSKVATTVGNVPLSAASGVSYRTLQQAAKSGLTDNPLFWQHANGIAPATDVINAVKGGIQDIATDRRNAWISGMSDADAQLAGKSLDYSRVDAALAQNRQMLSPNGLSFNPNSPSARLQTQLEQLVDAWKNNPNNQHTMFQFDQLKQGIRDFGTEQTEKGSLDRKLIDNAANAAKNTIPSKTYRDTMDAYGQASQNLTDMNRDLMSGRSTGAQIRSLLKNLDTQYKGGLLDQVAAKNPNIPAMIAGQEIANAKPSRLRELLPFGAAYAAGNPLPIAAGIASSPSNAARISYYTGRVGGIPANIYKDYPLAAKAAYQAGHAEDVVNANPPVQQRATGGRIGRATGGRAQGAMTADMLIAAAERAKKSDGKATSSLLDQPDETITRALAIANKNI